MTRELEEKLYKDFPELFAQAEESNPQNGMYYGADVGDGWEPILRRTSEILTLQRRTYFARKKSVFPKLRQKIKTKFHNLCRRIEKLLKIKAYTLYAAKYQDFAQYAGWSIEFAQIKEKFGLLRIYYDIRPLFKEADVAHLDAKSIEKDYHNLQGFVEGVITCAEVESSKICETHGAPGKLKRSGWWKVICENCEK
jgi:hypothetical protein